MTQDYEQQIERHYRWNFGIIAGVEGCWGFSSAFVNYVAILPMFLAKLGASELVIGLLPTIFMLSLTAPQLLVARLTRRMPVKKVFFALAHYPGTMPLLLLALLTELCSESWPKLVICSTFVWVSLFGVSIGFTMPLWVNLMAKLFPAPVRGRSFGYVFLLYGVCGTAGAVCVKLLLGAWAYPYNFTILFTVGGVLLSGGVTTFFWLREPPSPVSEAEGAAPLLSDVVSILRGSRSFVWFLVARFVGALSMMAAAFYTVAGVERFNLPSSAAGTFSIALLSAQMVGSLVGGRLGDNFGFRLLIILAPIADAAAAALAIFAPSSTWYATVFVLFGLRTSFGMIGSQNLTIEFSPSHDKTTFVALSSTILCPAYVLGPVFGGLLAKHHPAHYNATFVVAIVCSLIALVITVIKVAEPRRISPPA